MTDGINLGGEPIICTYIDLEALIESCDFSPRERSVLDDLMYGYNSQDIADRFAITRQTVDVMFKRAVKKIVEENNRRWQAVHGK
jgi:DNA-binding NarL/FixJ family response regulator